MLSFWAADNGGPVDELLALLGGTTVYDLVNGPGDQVYRQYTGLAFVATSTTTRLQFNGRNDTFAAVFLDDVCVDVNGGACGTVAVGGCPAHTIHGHLPGSSAHIGNTHEHHGQHGHTSAVGCPPHAPGHSPGLMPETGAAVVPLDGPEIVGAINEEGSLNGNAPGIVGAAALRPARRGTALELFARAQGLPIEPLPEVWIGGVKARVLYSGPAPGLSGGWQINVEIPVDAPAAPAVHVRVVFGDYELPSLDIWVQ